MRTFYLQAKTSGEVQEWVAAIDEARRNLQATSAQKHSSNPIPIPNAGRSAHAPPPITPSPPSFASYAQTITSSDSEDAAPSGQRSGQRTYSSSSQPGIAISSSPSHAAAVKDPAKTVLSGYLMKCGSKRKNWRKRWFVLTGEKLVYSASHMVGRPSLVSESIPLSLSSDDRIRNHIVSSRSPKFWTRLNTICRPTGSILLPHHLPLSQRRQTRTSVMTITRSKLSQQNELCCYALQAKKTKSNGWGLSEL